LSASAAAVSSTALSSHSTTIPPIHIKAAKNTSHSLINGPKTIVTQQQIRAAGVTTLAQALSELGGVQLQDTAGNGSQLSMNLRGFGANASSNTLLLVNGIPITNPDLAPPDLNAIPLHDIEYIEIMAGSESVLYGDQAVGGIINIVTRQQAKEKMELSCSAGSYRQHYCYAALHNQFKRLHYNVALSNHHTNNYREHNDYDQNVLIGNVSYPYQTGRVSFDYQIANEDMQYPGALTAQQVRQDRQQANNDIDFFKNENTFFHLKQQQQVNSNWLLQTDLAQRGMHGHGVFSLPFNQSRNTYFIKPQLKGTIGNVLLTSGIDLQKDNYHLGSTFGLTNNSQQKYGVFGIATIPISEPLFLSVGARGAYQGSHLQSTSDSDTINRVLTTTVGATYHLLTDFDIYLRQAGSFRFPKADEMATTPIGVKALRAQRGTAYETGIQLNRDNYSGKLGIYQLNLRDEIAFDPTQTPQQPFGANKNLSPTVRRGITLSGKNKITDRLSLGGQYNYVDARFQNGTDSGNRIPLVSAIILRANIDYTIAEYWTIYTEALYTGNQFAANDNANVAGKMGGYTLYNFNLRFSIKELSASLRVNNIFNKRYYFYTVFMPNMQSEFFYPAPERNFTLTVTYAFA
jgi:iron complex outermembrane recepter protein